MKLLWLLPLIILTPLSVKAELITPAFTQGSMQATTTTTQTITESIETEVFGGAYSRWTGENVQIDTTNGSATGGIAHANQVFQIHTAGDPFTLETVTRAAGVVQTIDTTRNITTNATTTSLSVFSQ